jgi:hypothetical protein
MSVSLFAAQEAVYAALSASGVLQGMIGNPVRLYDMVPPAAAFPYVTLGDISARDYDTRDRDGFEQIVILHVWSRARGRKELKTIMQAVYDTLHHASLTLTGADFVSCRFQSAVTQQERDGLTLHGVMRFRIIVQH